MLIAEAVTIVFILLKVTSIVAWSWLWVFSPMIIVYGSLVLMFALVLGGYIVVMIVVVLMDKYHDWSLERMKKK